MVHCFVYPNGLDGQIGDLILLPRSHTVVMDRGRDVIGGLFGSEPLPGSITISHLEPGSVVVVHSALLHGRRAKPGGASRPRYFTDISFCQHPRNDSARGDSTHRHCWPSYQVATRPSIDSPGGHAEVFAAHRKHRRDSSDVAKGCGIFDLSVFWDCEGQRGTDEQLAALQQAPGRRQPRL